MEVVVTTGPLVQSSTQIITTNKPTSSFFTGQMPFLSPNQQYQSTEGKISHSMDLLTPSSPGVFQLCLWPLTALGYLGEGRHASQQPSDASTPVYNKSVIVYENNPTLPVTHHSHVDSPWVPRWTPGTDSDHAGSVNSPWTASAQTDTPRPSQVYSAAAVSLLVLPPAGLQAPNYHRRHRALRSTRLPLYDPAHNSFYTCSSHSIEKCFPSVLWHCWFGDRKGIRPVKSWMLVCWWWWSDWSFECLIAPVVTITSILSSSIIQNWDIVISANPGPPEKMAVKMERHSIWEMRLPQLSLTISGLSRMWQFLPFTYDW